MPKNGPNYYADIKARLGFEPQLAARMQRFNILCDREERGEYLQFYSRAIAKRIFSEVVECRGYDAFGATNAAVRPSAQSLHHEAEWV